MSMSPVNASNESSNERPKETEPSETLANLRRKHGEFSAPFSWVSKRFFTEKDVEEASNALVFAPPDWRGINFGELATCLREKGFNGLVRRISKLSERFFNIAEPDVPRNPEESEESLPEMWLQTLDVVRYLASKIGPGSSFNVQDPSEADLVFLWRELLCGMAPDGFMTMSGERVTASSKTVTTMLNDNIGDFGTFGCKVDLELLFDGNEVCVFEFKVGGAGNQLFKLQYFKCILVCLNCAVMEEQFKRTGSREVLYFMCIEGWKAYLYGLYPHKEIVVSKRLRQIYFPRSKEELISFLEDGSLNVIKYIMECIHEAAVKGGRASSSSTDEAATPLLTKDFMSHFFCHRARTGQIINIQIDASIPRFCNRSQCSKVA
ncbi:hypothetical protein B0O80DRAFT_497894 [Mortierella sp. GBAus27b]|nr:hypothetical protein B0O80DRAFT_497894 [Mortierella sp. GBAus27b]